jgi:hypothetical protein
MISALEAAQRRRVSQQRLAQAIEWQIGPPFGLVQTVSDWFDADL